MTIYRRFTELIEIHAFGHPSPFYRPNPSVLDPTDRTVITLEELEELSKYVEAFNHNLKEELALRKKCESKEEKQL